MNPSPLLTELGRIGLEAGEIARTVREDMTRELKSDGSIVTDADRAVEVFLRKELPQLVPGTTVWGEEFGMDEEGPSGRWAVDPIDGTSNFAFGSPLWGVCISLVRGSELLIAAGNLPDLGENYLAERNGGAFRNGKALPSIPPGIIRPEELVTTSESLVKRFGEKLWPGKLRNSGAAVIDGTFTACQRFRGLLGYREHLYDVGPSLLLGLELGADVRYADGSPIDFGNFGVKDVIPKPWIVFPRQSGYVWPDLS